MYINDGNRSRHISLVAYIHTSGTTRRNPTNRFAHIYIYKRRVDDDDQCMLS